MNAKRLCADGWSNHKEPVHVKRYIYMTEQMGGDGLGEGV